MKKWAYYNDTDPFACEWAKELIKAGLVLDGEVDCRDMREIEPQELEGFIQVHLFSGILGWAYGLQLAGWPIGNPVWTGSCPCQPFSAAGKGGGVDDPRHLWPAFRWLIAQCRPKLVFGEQVASKLAQGWLVGVYNDLEALGYRVPHDEFGNYEAYSIPACSVGAPHIRQRLWWVADAEGGNGRLPDEQRTEMLESERGGEDGRLADAAGCSSEQGEPRAVVRSVQGQGEEAVGGLADPQQFGRRGRDNGCDAGEEGETITKDQVTGSSASCGLANAEMPKRGRASGENDTGRGTPEAGGPGPWSDFTLVPCADGKARRVGAGIFPLAHGLPFNMGRPRAILEGMGYGAKDIRRILRRPRSLLALAGKHRVGVLRGAGNAICPQAAAEFVRAYLEPQG